MAMMTLYPRGEFDVGPGMRRRLGVSDVGRGAGRNPNRAVQRQLQDAQPMISQSFKDGKGRDRSHQVAEAAKSRLQESSYGAIRRLSCDCRRGILFLRGHLPTFYQKQLAQEAVAKLEGVLQVMNEAVVDTRIVWRHV
jgi:osmotically-inducible protein OsmY